MVKNVLTKRSTMPALTRRSFLAASAAMAAGPAYGAVPASGYLEVVVIGAGAAGIAAARRLAAAGRRFALVEASARVGGRCITDTSLFGVPFDRGARWVRSPDANPVAKLAAQAKLELYPAPPGQTLRIGRRNAREGEMEFFLSSLGRASRAIADAGRAKVDIAAAKALPKIFEEWNPVIDFVLGPYGCTKDLTDVSAYDFARQPERDADAFCRQGYGTLLAKLADGLPVRLSTPVTAIDWAHNAVSVETPKGTLTARAVIMTASTNVLMGSSIRYRPGFPKRHLDALAKLSLGSLDHIALELEGNPLGLRPDDLVFEKAAGNRTAALLAHAGGTPLCLIDVGGRFGKSLADQGEAAMVAFATDWLADLYGADVKKAVKRGHATRWSKEPYVLGASSVAAPGAQPGRRVLMEPLNNRIWLAGEAVHETLWGTVNGAWESGERAAEAVIKRLGRG
jgi:monoamine oxidase